MKFILKRSKIVFLVTSMVLIAGIISMYLLPIKILPVISSPYVTITAIPENELALDTMETEIAIPLENIIFQSDAVKHVDVNTTSEFVSMTIELEDTSKEEEVEKLVKELDGTLNAMSFDFEFKSVRQVISTDQSIMGIAIIPESIQDENVRDELINILIPELRKIKGVNNVHHSLDAYEMDLVLELNAEEITSIEQGASFMEEIASLPTSSLLGFVEDSSKKQKISSETSITSIGDLEDYQLHTGKSLDEVVKLKEQNQIDLKFFHEVNGSPYYLLQIMVSEKADEIAISKEIKDTMKKIQKSQHTNWDYLYEWDSSEFISQSIKELVINILFGAIVAVAILLTIFKSIKTVLVIGMSIPVSISAAFVMIYIFGYTINMITLLGIGIGTGLIIDACIVVLDNISKNLDDGNKILDAVIKGTKEIATPVISSILTTVVVFIPAGFIAGEIGEMAKEMALAVICSLLASLVVALTIIPIFSFYLVREKKTSKTLEWVLSKYQSLLEFSLSKKWLVLFLSVVTLLASIFLFIEHVPKNYMPNVSERAYVFNYEVDDKKNYEENKQLMEDTAQQILLIDGVQNVYTRGDENNYNSGRFLIQYDPESEMNRSEQEVNQDIQATIDELVPYQSHYIQEGYADNSSQIQLSASSSFSNNLPQKIDALKEEIMQLEGVNGVHSDTTEESEDWIIQYSSDELRSSGFSNQQINQYVSLALNGVRNISMNLDGEDRDLHIQFPDNVRNNIDELYKLPISKESNTTLNDISNLKEVIAEKNRIRRDGQYEETISILTAPEMREQVVEELDKYINKNSDSNVTLSFAGIEQEQSNAYNNLLIAAAIAFSVVYIILILQFNRIRQPFLIMLSLPFSLIGIAFGFILTGRTFDIIAMIGVIVLMGIAVSNSIIFIDFINKNRNYYNSTRLALIEAGKARFRPIITTTITTIGGLIPMVIGGSYSSNYQTPIATVVIFGLIISTWSSLILLPIFYEILEKRDLKKERKF